MKKLISLFAFGLCFASQASSGVPSVCEKMKYIRVSGGYLHVCYNKNKKPIVSIPSYASMDFLAKSYQENIINVSLNDEFPEPFTAAKSLYSYDLFQRQWGQMIIDDMAPARRMIGNAESWKVKPVSVCEQDHCVYITSASVFNMLVENDELIGIITK